MRWTDYPAGMPVHEEVAVFAPLPQPPQKDNIMSIWVIIIIPVAIISVGLYLWFGPNIDWDPFISKIEKMNPFSRKGK